MFVCQHGALRSRLAAAFFNAVAPAGWHAISAGFTPQSEVSARLMPLLKGTGVEEFADLEPPRLFDPGAADRAISIDEPIGGVERWRTSGSDEQVRDQIRNAVALLVQDLDE